MGGAMKKIVNILAVLSVLGMFGIALIPDPVSAMTGSGTPGDPYMIYDVDDLQDMEDDLDAYYELANDINAGATAGWNGGKGFAPIGSGTYNEDHTWTDPILITSDHSSGGSWVLEPAGGTLTSKLLTNDGGTSYISTTTTNSWALFNLAEAIDLHPDASYIYVFFQMDCRRMSSSYSYIYPYMRIGGVNYVGYDANLPTNGEYLGTYYCSRAWETTNPATGNPWTALEVESIEAFGFIATDASPEIRITRFSVCVQYSLVFTGSFDGNGYTISDLYVNWVPDGPFEPYQAAGLFGQADDATFRDVTISDATVNGGYYAGILVGECWNNAGNVTVEDVHVSGDVEGWGILGGLAGKLGYWADDGESVTVTDCSSSGTVSTAFDESGEYVGGLIGEIAYGTITDCSSSSNVEAWWTTVAGGLIGECDYSDLFHCYATGDVLAVDLADGAGGLIGYFGGYDGVWSSVSECFSTGDVLAIPDGAFPCDTTFYVGGLVGDSFCLNVSNSYSRGDVATSCTTGYLGGFLGYADGWIGENATATNCYATGLISGGGTFKGGFIGYIDAYVTNTACFWDEDTSGLSDGVGFGSESGIQGCQTAQMKTKTTFTSSGWQFTPDAPVPVWAISDNCNDGYPYICSFCYLPFICIGGDCWDWGGINQVVWFQPNDLIYGDTLPDRMSNEDGAITWGANPAGITIDVGSLISAEQPEPWVDTDTPGPQDMLPEAESPDWFVEPDISGTLSDNPLRPFVRILSDNSAMTEWQAWRFLGLVFVIFCTAVAAFKLRGHLFIAGITCAVAMAILIQQTIWPLWSIVFVIAAVVAGIIAERTPQA
jgi:hypothetical protein